MERRKQVAAGVNPQDNLIITPGCGRRLNKDIGANMSSLRDVSSWLHSFSTDISSLRDGFHLNMIHVSMRIGNPIRQRGKWKQKDLTPSV